MQIVCDLSADEEAALNYLAGDWAQEPGGVAGFGALLMANTVAGWVEQHRREVPQKLADALKAAPVADQQLATAVLNADAATQDAIAALLAPSEAPVNAST